MKTVRLFFLRDLSSDRRKPGRFQSYSGKTIFSTRGIILQWVLSQLNVFLSRKRTSNSAIQQFTKKHFFCKKKTPYFDVMSRSKIFLCGRKVAPMDIFYKSQRYWHCLLFTGNLVSVFGDRFICLNSIGTRERRLPIRG